MRLGLLTPSIGEFGQVGFYNSQQIGLAKAMDCYFEEIIIYQLIHWQQPHRSETVDQCKNTVLKSIPSRTIGNNGLLDVSYLDPSLDVLIFFSDVQLIVPRIYRWAKKNKVKLYPYIGVLESHSTSVIKRIIMNAVANCDINVYKKCHCFAKTPEVSRKLKSTGVSEVTVAAVGLDTSILNKTHQKIDKGTLKKKYGFKPTDSIILYIGRFISEKQPIRMIDIFNDVKNIGYSYKLIMVGKGPLKNDVNDRIESLGLEKDILLIDKIPNNKIWELYRISDCFVNLNQQEIFGMAILEAMYYGCKVVAWEAPGPSFIIEDGVSGWLVNDNAAVCERIICADYSPESGVQRVLNHFTWDATAMKMLEVINSTNN